MDGHSTTVEKENRVSTFYQRRTPALVLKLRNLDTGKFMCNLLGSSSYH